MFVIIKPAQIRDREAISYNRYLVIDHMYFENISILISNQYCQAAADPIMAVYFSIVYIA